MRKCEIDALFCHVYLNRFIQINQIKILKKNPDINHKETCKPHWSKNKFNSQTASHLKYISCTLTQVHKKYIKTISLWFQFFLNIPLDQLIIKLIIKSTVLLILFSQIKNGEKKKKN